MTHMKKADLKKEMEDSFAEMETLLQKASYALSIAKKYPDAESLVVEADEMMKQWSKVAKKYVAASKAYHNMAFGKMPI